MAKKPNDKGLTASDFLSSFLEKKKVRLDPESRNTINNDKWDKEDFRAIRKELRELPQAQKDLLGITSTGIEAVEDSYYSLKKPVPEIKEDKDIRPSYMINGRVMDESMQLPEWEVMRASSVADEVAAALAAVEIEPKLEIIFDKMKHEQKLAEELEQQMMAAEGLSDEIEDAEEQMEKIKAEGSGQGDRDGELQDLQAQQEKAKEALEKLKKEMQKTADEIDEGVEKKMPEARNTMREALEEANEKQDDLEQIQKSWGLDRGALHKLPAKRRIELAARVSTERFRRIAQVFGAVMRLTIAQQKKKTMFAKNEVCDIHLGNDISYVLPVEFMNLSHPVLKMEFYRKYLQRGLLQYKLEGEEKVAKGDIIYCDDGSGSMSGDPEIWAKAVGLALLNVARNQKRGFYGVHFGSPGEYATFDFKPDKNVEYYHNGKTEHLDTIDGTIKFAELFFGGGPLRVDQKVATPDGWKLIGDMTAGDLVYKPDGKPVAVEGVYPQGVLQDVYRVTFRDGASVVCDDTHIWNVRSKLAGSELYKNMRLSEIREAGLVYEHKNGSRYNFNVPLQAPVEVEEKDFNIQPYLLGYLLGDGTFGGGRSVTIASSENDFPWEAYLPEGVSVSEFSAPTAARAGSYGLIGKGRGTNGTNALIESLESLSLKGVRSEDKFVPEQYLWGSVSQRMDLLSGLLDSDGSTCENGGFEFSNISKNLAEAVVHLAQSLGGVATLNSYAVRANEKALYRVNGRIASSLGAPFKLARKNASYVIHSNEYNRSIVSIEKIEDADCICIKVANNEGLFLTEGFVTTHNTDFMTPLTVALTQLQKQYEEFGATKGDIVFATDGFCSVEDNWLKEFKEEQKRLGFKVYGIVIGGDAKQDPLHTICDGRVFTVRSLVDGGDISHILGEV